MRTLSSLHSQLVLAAAFSCALIMASPSLAAKGGNGGGKPGGGEDPPPPAAPIVYSVAAAALPGSSSVLYGHNEAAAMVGSLYGSPAGDRRAVAFVPGIASIVPGLTSDNFVLDDHPGLIGKPGWHTRSAVDINSSGTIVGNLEPNDIRDTLMRSYVVTGATTATPVLHELPLLDPAAQKEAAVAINDSGDIVVWSQRVLADGTTAKRMYVGNPGLDGEVSEPFIDIDFAPAGFPNPNLLNDRFSITNRMPNGRAVAVGEFVADGQRYAFRVNDDGSGLEISPRYVTADGARYWIGSITLDVNASGDVTGGAAAEPSKGKGRRNLYAGLWEYGSDEILPVGNFDPLDHEWWTAALNDDGDYLLQGGEIGFGDALWYGDWSATNGELQVTSLLDPDDPYGYLYSSTYDLTNRNADGWPTILAEGSETLADGTSQPYWLILTPQLTTSILASTAVPEPASVILFLLAVSSFAVVRRVI